MSEKKKEKMKLPTEATVELGKKFDKKKWKLNLINTFLLKMDPIEIYENRSYRLFFCCINFFPKNIIDSFSQQPPESYILEITIKPSDSNHKLRVISIATPDELYNFGLIDRSKMGATAAQATNALGELLTAGSVFSGLLLLAGSGALLKGGGLIANHFFGKHAITRCIPFISDEISFGWKFNKTDTQLIPFGIIESIALLEIDDKTDKAELTISLHFETEGKIETKKFIEVK